MASTSGQMSNVELSKFNQGNGGDTESGSVAPLVPGVDDHKTGGEVHTEEAGETEEQLKVERLEKAKEQDQEDIKPVDQTIILVHSEEAGETEEQLKARLEKTKKQLAVEQDELRVKLRLYQEEEDKSAESYYLEEIDRKLREARQREKEKKKLQQGNRKEERKLEEKPLIKRHKDTSFSEIKNLVFIENSPIHKKALEEWERKEKLFSSRVERKSTKVGNLKNEVYQLIGFFSVFQGVVLTAVSQSNLLHCNNKVYPIILSVLASAVTIAAIAQKLIQISSFQKTIYSEEASLKDAVHKSGELRLLGEEFKFAKFTKEKKIVPKRDCFGFYSSVVVVFLLAFTVLFPVSYWRILCNPGSCGTGPPPA
ncbi:hypothetical protein KC19_3G025100 [Ceratodon purpureus]|uniref:Transmembrane protein n=1 Tax=Ceratodon purpureus TaxID=3225 RepID=A0A8T0IGM8_CERPU|nr:hypothetical protein KC19_3G025100 [Ceratodon purpureus]